LLLIGLFLPADSLNEYGTLIYMGIAMLVLGGALTIYQT
jgi:hypothetical protein